MIKYNTIVTSTPDREKLVVEIWDNDQMIAEINQENTTLAVEIYFNANKQPLRLNYKAFLEALEEGKQKLVGSKNL
jgi:hypothetical protein